MPRARGLRARYQQDLESAGENDIPNISHISRPQGDGEFIFIYSHALLPSPSVLEIQVVPQEFSSYPSEHFFMVFAHSEEIPPAIAKTLEDFTAASSGLKVHAALTMLSRNFTAAVEQANAGSPVDDGDAAMTDAEDEENDDLGFGSNEDGSDFEDFEYNEDNDEIFGLADDRKPHVTTFSRKVTPEMLSRIRRDFRSVRGSGFKLAKLCGFDEPTEYSIVSVSAQVDRLCLSEEARDAWNLKKEDFIVLLLRYSGNYTTYDDAIDRAAETSNLAFRVRKCSKYKPSINAAVEAFAPRPNTRTFGDNTIEITRAPDEDSSDLSMFGIGQSIDTFMDSEFIPMLKVRVQDNVSWDVAKRRLLAMSRNMSTGHVGDIETNETDTDRVRGEMSDQDRLPAFLANDHLISKNEISLPVIAAQFAMRYLIRCTDYCMVCHQKVEGDFEALKPYVCGDSLCLFQYMTMGFGPSIDQEIMNQPNVVDLLVSFCYAGLRSASTAALGSGIRDFPSGLNLQVPKILPGLPPPAPSYDNRSSATQPCPGVQVNGGTLIDPLSVSFDWDQSTVQIEKADIPRVKEGMWVAIVSPQDNVGAEISSVVHHGRVEVFIGRVATLRIASRHTLPISTETNEAMLRGDARGELPSHMVFYNQNLDDLDGQGKSFAMMLQLAATPSVESMRTYLVASPNRQIERWERLTPAASKLLRWIVASNRSYIVQVDECPLDSEGGLARHDERITGVDGWIQFRFAQGSPEKEVQFQEELKRVAKPQKTILAWHGSDICNWHSIIRQGLDYKYIANGRAHGNGVYFGRDFNTSLGYASRYRYDANNRYRDVWPNSSLKITAAISLNELINKPEDFQNTSWCLVVQHVHWIQCRYLFVRPLAVNADPSMTYNFAIAGTTSSSRKVAEFIQDKTYTATGPANNKIFVPLAAIPSAQDSILKNPLASMKREAKGHSGDSGDEDAEDIDFLPIINALSKQSTAVVLQANKTDFRPGALDLATLPRLNPPSYATNQAQKTIGREINKLQRVQSTTPLHELGWYIDFDNITNMFHWIVELHSIEASLPLAKDMKAAGVTSIVLELRFGRDFPLSPPFVRVIRPRFLPFMNGGGGHVTAGGAMCMELLTHSGWSPVSSLEAVLLQVRLAMCSLDPKPARLESTIHARDYGVVEAFDAYTRAATAHGWQVPQDLREATTDMTVRTDDEKGV
ncbi:polymerase [Xylariales sp. AK1849]|nr:polymerase [Xylariales sp. AK1849]